MFSILNADIGCQDVWWCAWKKWQRLLRHTDTGRQSSNTTSTGAAIYSISPVNQEPQGNTVSLLKTSSCLNYHKQAAAQGLSASAAGLHHHVQEIPTMASKIMELRNWNLLVHTNTVCSLLMLQNTTAIIPLNRQIPSCLIFKWGPITSGYQ